MGFLHQALHRQGFPLQCLTAVQILSPSPAVEVSHHSLLDTVQHSRVGHRPAFDEDPVVKGLASLCGMLFYTQHNRYIFSV